MEDNSVITKVECPVVGRKIKDIECIECREIVDGNYPEKYLVDMDEPGYYAVPSSRFKRID